jgi:FkbM family methyltransferase
MIFISIVRKILNIFDSFQQRKIINILKRSNGDNLIIFDVGSHLGETVKLFSSNLNIKKIHCFEASNLNFKILKNNLFKNKLINICVINNVAIGDVEGKNFLNQTKESSSSTINAFNENSSYLKRKLKILNIGKINNFYQKIPINIIKLSTYIKKNKITNIDILKIDTEGFELNVVKSLEDCSGIVKNIYFEHHYDDMIKKNYTYSDINQTLINLGFKKTYKSKMIFKKSFEYIYINTNI